MQYETVTRETGSTTNLYRTGYAYSYVSYHRQVIRTEQNYNSGWVDDFRVTYKYDGMERQSYEKREDYDPYTNWTQMYLNEQEYDKCGNRTRLDKNVTAGQTANYGSSMDLSYTYNNVNSLTAIADSDDANYSATVTCDANGNITEIHEQSASGGDQADLYTYFTLDWNNRVTDWKVKRYDFGASDWEWTKREHEYDATNRLVNSTYKQWFDGEEEPSGDSLEHIYAGSRHIQNYDGSSTYGERWHWSCDSHMHNSPLRSPNPDTSSQTGFNISNTVTPQRHTFIDPSSEGDERHLYGQGKPMPKDASGAGTYWGTGIQSDDPAGVLNPLSSRLNFDGTVAPTDMDRATDIRDKAQIGILGSALSYRGSDGRVSSETIGRDINPMGRGDGTFYAAGDLRFTGLYPSLRAISALPSLGNTVNGGRDYSVGNFTPLGPINTGFHPGTFSGYTFSNRNDRSSIARDRPLYYRDGHEQKACCYSGPDTPHACPPQFTDVIPNPVYHLVTYACRAHSSELAYTKPCNDNHPCVNTQGYSGAGHKTRPYERCAMEHAPDVEATIGYAYKQNIECIIGQYRYCHHVCGAKIPNECSKYYMNQDETIMRSGHKGHFGAFYPPSPNSGDCKSNADSAAKEIKKMIDDRAHPCNCFLSQHNFDWIEYGLKQNPSRHWCTDSTSANCMLCADSDEQGFAYPRENKIGICCMNWTQGPAGAGHYCSILNTIAHEYSHIGAYTLAPGFYSEGASQYWPDLRTNTRELYYWSRCVCHASGHGGGPLYGECR
ncbi:hypothetical protein JW859_10025 [bacterium]|nr:hypothetical protein [bacterium]